MIEVRTKSVDDTRALAGEVAGLARPGDVVVLAGDLGAGKTAFVQGFGRALGVQEPITSPTFTLVRSYEARLPLHHVDVYRLDRLQEFLDLGVPELLDQGGVTLVEWGDAVAPALPADFLECRLGFGEAEDERRIGLRPAGPSWSARQRQLAEVLVAWTERS